MSLTEYLTDNNFKKRDLTILFTVGCVLNTENGDTFPMLDDNTFDFTDGLNLMDMDADRRSSEEWFETLAWNEDVVVEDTINYLKEKSAPEQRINRTDHVSSDWFQSSFSVRNG